MLSIRQDLLRRHAAWSRASRQLVEESSRLQADSRIHAALYFLSPHRFKEVDRVFLTQLSDVVPIVPVIAKADTMTAVERKAYLLYVMDALKELEQRVGHPLCYDFKENELSIPGSSSLLETYTGEAEEIKDEANQRVFPGTLYRAENLFAVVADTCASRIYPWGVLDIMNEAQSDFRRLQRLLFEGITSTCFIT
jgi:septin family protein